jgi:hypothetical protein
LSKKIFQWHIPLAVFKTKWYREKKERSGHESKINTTKTGTWIKEY